MKPAALHSLGVALVLMVLAGQTLAQEHADVERQRQAIDAQRRALLGELDAQAAACATRFFVNDCRSGVDAQRRKAVADFKRQELALDDVLRRQRAAEQLQRSADRQQERQARDSTPSDPAETPAARLQRQADKQAAHQQQAQAAQRGPSQPKTPTGPDASARQRNQEDYDEKVKALQQRRSERDQRLRDHPDRAAPLPVPP